MRSRYARRPSSPVDYHRARAPRVRDEDVFCLEHTRTVSNDFVVQFGRRGLQLDPKVRGRVPAGSKVLVRESRDVDLRIIHVNRRGEERELAWTPAVARKASPAVASRVGSPAQSRPRPSADHPFRRANALSVARAAIARAGGY